ncbi:MAG TPA: serine/threonine phosphatase [Trichocoleus sp.]
MLICPECLFENPDNNKFCQQCGVSLVEQTCPSCGFSVPFTLAQCPQCHAATGIARTAILSLSTPRPPSSSEGTGLDSPGFPEAAPGQYLDAQQRYQLLEPITNDPASEEADRTVRVLDCNPLQASLLQILYPQLDRTPPASTATTPLNIPALAQRYLDLQAEYPSLPLPKIYDAWESQGISLILLEDRSHFIKLANLWEDQAVLPLQILHWLHEMTELWAVLEPQHCRRSLLELSNLYVDEDHLLCLQRLYEDLPDRPPTLQDLGILWQRLFQQSQRTLIGELVVLCQELILGKVDSVKTLRSRIETIAITLQSHSEAIAMSSDPTEPLHSSPNPEQPLQKAVTPAAAQPPASPPTDPPTDSLTFDADDYAGRSTAIQFSDTENEGGTDSDDLPTVVLPMRLVSLEDAGRTDVGRQRDHNEDCFSIHTEVVKNESLQGRTMRAKGLYILCDGMGGHAGGEVASALAVETLRKYFATHWQERLPSEACIRDAIQQANSVIYDLNQQNARSGSGRMGTTLVLVLIQDTEAAVAHVGDSRLYRFSRRRGLEQVTLDHEVGQREIQRGVEPTIAYARPDAYQLTQALGPRDEHFINPDVKFLEVNEDLLLVLCSDGLSDNDLLESHWHTHLEPLLSTQTNLEQGASQLIELGNRHNGHDNITAIVIRAKVRPDLEMLGQKLEQVSQSHQEES